MTFDLLKDVFNHVKIPKSFYETKKIINKLGLNYIKIDACPNDCMLYWNEDESKESCKKWHSFRQKPKGKGNKGDVPSSGKKGNKILAKVLCYFPL